MTDLKKMSKRMIVSAGVVPVRKENGKYLYLLLRNNDYWEFPKGKQEEDENVFDAAMRETCEETSLTPADLKFDWGKVSKQTDKYKKGKKYVVYFIASTNVEKIGLPINPELGKAEHHEARWVEYDEGRELLNDRMKKIIDWANNIIAGNK